MLNFKWLILSCLCILLVCQASGLEVFFYFAYGSNLLSNRIKIKNPSAVFYGPAKLSGYRLDFNIISPLWNGAVATIVPDTNGTVWGDLWLIDAVQLKNLDKQEGVDQSMYFAKNVTVERRDGFQIKARTYIETHNPSKLAPGEVLPEERRPSDTYMQVIILGAIESRLPNSYIQYLRTIPTNIKKARKEMLEDLGTVGYRLDFNMQVPMWNGAVATIVPDTHHSVWGDLWLIDNNKMKYLDEQEGKNRGWYYAKNVTVKRRDGYRIRARTYIETHNPHKLAKGKVLPYERRPSETYMKVIILGAIESKLPNYYIKYLKTFPTNHKKATKETLKKLGAVDIVHKNVYKFN